MSGSPPSSKKIVLFHRDFQRFTGGHLKVWNYFCHVLASKTHEPRITFTADSKWNATNPWSSSRDYIVNSEHVTPDVWFLAGADWKRISSESLQNPAKPVINLIQHPRHADPKDELYEFLKNRAIRICVSQQVADAIQQTGVVNGQVFVIPNGISLTDIPPRPRQARQRIKLLICGMKAPELAREVEAQLQRDENIAVVSLLEWMPRPDYLDQLNHAEVAVMLPRPEEGFYLPALEAMACGAIVVCPDCVGNRDFCQDGINSFRPAYDADGIIAAIYAALALPPNESDNMRERAAATVRAHSLERERDSFLNILDRVDDLWAS